MQRLEGWSAFVNTAAQGSFSAAARLLELTPAAISKSVAGLERELGVRLFNRTTRRLRLTDEGAVFLEKAREALAMLDEAADTVRARRAVPEGLVRASVGGAFGRRYVLPLLPEFCAAHPRVRIELALDDRPADLVQEGFDLGIRGGRLKDSSMVSRTICRIPTALVAAPRYLARAGVPARMEDLKDHRCIVTRFLSGASAGWNFRVRGKAVDVEPQGDVIVSDPESAAEAAALGLGVAQVGVHHAWAHFKAGRLKTLLNAVHDPGQRLMAIHYPHRAHLAPRVRVFVEFLLERLGQEEALHAAPRVLKDFEAVRSA